MGHNVTGEERHEAQHKERRSEQEQGRDHRPLELLSRRDKKKIRREDLLQVLQTATPHLHANGSQSSGAEHITEASTVGTQKRLLRSRS